MEDAADTRPILIVPYMWIGDCVRGHTVVRVLKQRWPNRPVDLLVTSLCAPLVDYMPGVHAGIVFRTSPGAGLRWPSNGVWRRSSAPGATEPPWSCPAPGRRRLPPALAGIPERVGFFGEARFGLINRMRWGEKALPRFIDKNAALALPARALAAGMAGAATRPPRKPPAGARPTASDRARGGVAPGSVGASKRWNYYPQAARLLIERGLDVWVVGGLGEKALAQDIVAAGGGKVRDLAGSDLRNGVLAMAAAGVAVSNDFGLMHIAAAIGTPTMGIFGPTSPYLWAPLNGLAATVLQTKGGAGVPALPAHGLHHERPSLHARHRCPLRGRDRAAPAGDSPQSHYISAR